MMPVQAPLKLFLCVRWGHAESEEGADGEDTNILVRARDHEEAASLADAALARMPTHVAGNRRSVEPYCSRVMELGTDASGAEPALVLRPWIAHAFPSATEVYRCWFRGELPDDFTWRPLEEVFDSSGRVVDLRTCRASRRTRSESWAKRFEHPSGSAPIRRQPWTTT